MTVSKSVDNSTEPDEFTELQSVKLASLQYYHRWYRKQKRTVLDCDMSCRLARRA